MDNGKKQFRSQNQEEMYTNLKREKISCRSDMNLQYLPETHNRSLEHRTIQPRKLCDQAHPIHVDDSVPKNVFTKMLRSSKQPKEVKIIFHAGERQNLLTNLSQDHAKAKSRHESPHQKNIANDKIKPYQFKQPEWFKARKKQVFQLKIPKMEENDKLQFPDQEIRTETSNNETNKARSGSGGYLAFSSINTAKFYRDKREQQLIESRCMKKSKIDHYEITNIKLEEEVKELKFKLENLEQDNNILLGRMQTLQAQLNASSKKINQYAIREELHRNNQLKLKEKIQDLESKLLLAKDQMNSKNQLHDSGYNEGFSHFLNNDKEVIQKKNEQISRLNEIINKTRNKVNQLNHLLSQERINSLQAVRSLEQKYESMIQKNEKKIKELKRMPQFRRQKISLANPHQVRVNTQNPGLEKSPDQQINRVLSAHVIPRNLAFLKSNI